MAVNHPVRAGIRAGKIESLESAIQTGKRDGMVPLDVSLEQLVAAGQIIPETARRYAKDPEALQLNPPPKR